MGGRVKTGIELRTFCSDTMMKMKHTIQNQLAMGKETQDLIYRDILLYLYYTRHSHNQKNRKGTRTKCYTHTALGTRYSHSTILLVVFHFHL